MTTSKIATDQSRQIILASRPEGEPQATNFRLDLARAPVCGLPRGRYFGKLLVKVSDGF